MTGKLTMKEFNKFYEYCKENYPSLDDIEEFIIFLDAEGNERVNAKMKDGTCVNLR